MSENAVSRREKIDAIISVARYNPRFAVLIVVLGLTAAVFEGIGMSFILPIVEIVQYEDPAAEADGYMQWFVLLYQSIGIPFTLGFVVLGLGTVMAIRFSLSFLVGWFREALRIRYRRDIQIRAFDTALHAEMDYFDEEGSDDIINTIITETYWGARVIKYVVNLLEIVFLSAIYLLIAFVLAPELTIIALVVLGGLTVLLRGVIEPGYELGDVVAETNEQRHAVTQAGMMGIRDIRLFGLAHELNTEFQSAVNRFADAKIKLRRNEEAILNFYNLGVALSVIGLIYVALTFFDLSVGALALFLFAMFQLGPKISSLNSKFYQVENNLPHLVRTQAFIRELDERQEPDPASRPVPSEITPVSFENVRFSYEDDEVLQGVDFSLDNGEFIAFVGQSGAGKSTIVSLLARFYEPDGGSVRANGEPIQEMDLATWRERIAIVRQDPYLFNDTLRFNLTIGNREASQAEIDRACRIARVDEFIDSLDDGYETNLGDDGVQLSGGQKQRVALARALLQDAELLILDEATSDLDSHLEQEVQQGIETMDREYTILTIAHRLSTVKNADRIYAMESGRIVEHGTHQDLIDESGTYADLYTLQSGG